MLIRYGNPVLKKVMERRGLAREDVSEAEIYIEFMIDLFSRLRRVYAAVFLVTLGVFFMPEAFLRGRLIFSNYRPAIYLILSTIIDHSVRRMISAGDVKIIITSPATAITAGVQLSLLLATLVCLPLIFKEFYEFVAPGLYFHERQLLKNSMIAFTFLFLLGAAISYFVVVPITLGILTITTNPLLNAGETQLLMFFSLESILYLVFWGVFFTGVLYTLPALLYLLVVLGILDAQYLVNNRKNVVLAILSVAAVITPDPTAVSMLIISVPLIVIYEIVVQKALQVQRNRELFGIMW